MYDLYLWFYIIKTPRVNKNPPAIITAAVINNTIKYIFKILAAKHIKNNINATPNKMSNNNIIITSLFIIGR